MMHGGVQETPRHGALSHRPERSVFVTVGSTRFDDLIRAVDAMPIAEALSARGYTALVLQVGAGQYRPKRLFPANSRSARLHSGLRVEWFDYAPSLASHLQAASLVITHAGSGSIFEALRVGKAVIAVPNPGLMDDHQRELAQRLQADGHLVAATPDSLLQALVEMDSAAMVPYQSGDPAGIVAAIDSLCGVSGRRSGRRPRPHATP